MRGRIAGHLRLGRRVCPAAVVVAAICASCGGKTSEGGTKVSPYGPAALPQLSEACPRGSPPSNLETLKACLAGLEFDTIAAVGDEQRLMVSPASPRYGPLAKIEPEKHGHQWPEDTLLRQGRIIARLFLRPNEKGDTTYKRKFGLAPGDTTYWWVQTRAGGKATSFFVSVVTQGNRVSSVTDTATTVESHKPGTFKQALARWLWYPRDEGAQGPCGSACCKSSGAK